MNPITATPKGVGKMRKKSSLAGTTVTIKSGEFKDASYVVEDWWQNVAGKSWMFCDRNPACLIYAMRTGFSELSVPTDDEVLYGKTEDGLGHLIHISEIETLA